VKNFFLSLCLSILCIPAFAGPTGKWYQFEILIFEQPTSPTSTETMPLATGLPLFTNSVSLKAPSASNQQDSFVTVPQKEWALQGLRRTGRVILHTRWRQFMSAQATVIPVHLWGGKQYIKSAVPDPLDLDPPKLISDAFPTVIPPYPWEVEGTLTARLSRYIHVDADFVFQKSDRNGVHPYRLTETRRMRSNALHYLDHPLFGIAILITPEKEAIVDKSLEEEESDDSSS
jgi:hypothetical protein